MLAACIFFPFFPTKLEPSLNNRVVKSEVMQRQFLLALEA